MFFEFLRFVLFVTAGFFTIISFAVLVSVIKRGPAGIADFARRGVGIKSWAMGSIPETRDGTSIDVIEGIEIAAHGRSIANARQTRGISAER